MTARKSMQSQTRPAVFLFVSLIGVLGLCRCCWLRVGAFPSSRQTPLPLTQRRAFIVQSGRTTVIFSTTNSSSTSIDQQQHQHQQLAPPLIPSISSIRLNKVLKATHSRRQADQLIADGRITVNGVKSHGCMVRPFVDTICLDGQPIVAWEDWNAISSPNPTTATAKTTLATDSPLSKKTTFSYIKYWKPRGVVCTTDRRVRGNLLDRLEQDDGCSVRRRYSRLYPVGRLDKDTTGLLLLTNDGRLPNAALRRQHKQQKVYHVRARDPLSEDDLNRLRRGVVITTVAQRDGKRAAPSTAPTLPCRVSRINTNDDHNDDDDCTVQIHLTEGRNRQIRKMLEAIGNEVQTLHRVQFGGEGGSDGGGGGGDDRQTSNGKNENSDSDGISLRGLKGPGDWQELRGMELELIHQILQQAAQAAEQQQQQKQQKQLDNDQGPTWTTETKKLGCMSGFIPVTTGIKYGRNTP